MDIPGTNSYITFLERYGVGPVFLLGERLPGGGVQVVSQPQKFPAPVAMTTMLGCAWMTATLADLRAVYTGLVGTGVKPGLALVGRLEPGKFGILMINHLHEFDKATDDPAPVRTVTAPEPETDAAPVEQMRLR